MKMYVLVREDLTKSQQAVQAGHALAEYMLKYPGAREWGNHTLIYLKVSREQLQDLCKKYTDRLRHVAAFKEPDLNDELTAFAFLEPTPEVKRIKLL